MQRPRGAQSGVTELEEGVAPPRQTSIQLGPHVSELVSVLAMGSMVHGQTVLLLSGHQSGILDDMAKATTTGRLADYERRYRQLAAQLAEVGFISWHSDPPLHTLRDGRLQVSR